MESRTEEQRPEPTGQGECRRRTTGVEPETLRLIRTYKHMSMPCFLDLFWQPGLAFFYGGLVPRTSVLTIMMQVSLNTLHHAIVPKQVNFLEYSCL